MEEETRGAAAAIKKQLQTNEPILEKLSAKLQKKSPEFALTIGRGSSDHACTYAKYILETEAEIVTASAAPSVVTIYQTRLKLAKALVLGISQSGKSPDICQVMSSARSAEATTLAIVNEIDSPLAKAAEYVLPICAGTERAVAATKSYIASLAAVAHFVAKYTKSEKLQLALEKLPSTLEIVPENGSLNSIIEEFQNVDRTLVIARGFGFPIAQEAALKFKETAKIQAEAFSSAEFLHGPFALIRKNHPFLFFIQNDASLQGTLDLAKKIKKLGGRVIMLAPEDIIAKNKLTVFADKLVILPYSIDPILDPIVAIQAFYLMVARLAVSRGYNPDQPENLHKVTETT
jgi:glucosamine--fructose-6-phosphate aminotransferase (isomerizing)